MAKAKKPSTEMQLDMFAPAVPVKPPDPVVETLPEPVAETKAEPAPVTGEARMVLSAPVRVALPESIRNQAAEIEPEIVADPVTEPEPVVTPAPGAAPEVVTTVVTPWATCAEAILASYIARWEPLVFLWSGGTPDVCAPYAGGTADQKGWKARWMDLALAERVLAQYGYALHSFHEGPFPGGGGARKARSWLRPRTTEERAKAPPVAVLAAALEVFDVLDDLARVRQQAIQ
jgi:hypothetical protein